MGWGGLSFKKRQNVRKMSKCQKDVKLSKRCQVVKCQKVKYLDYGGSDITRFTDIDVNFNVKYEGHQNWSKILSMHILRVFGYHNMWYQNWCQCLNLIMSVYFLWTFHSLDIWFFDNWHLFDNLTSLDIFAAPSPMCPIIHGKGWWGIWAMWHVPF